MHRSKLKIRKRKNILFIRSLSSIQKGFDDSLDSFFVIELDVKTLRFSLYSWIKIKSSDNTNIEEIHFANIQPYNKLFDTKRSTFYIEKIKTETETTTDFIVWNAYAPKLEGDFETVKKTKKEFKNLIGDQHFETFDLTKPIITVELDDTESRGQAWIKQIDRNLNPNQWLLSDEKINEYFGEGCEVTVSMNETETVSIQHIQIKDTSRYNSLFSAENSNSSHEE